MSSALRRHAARPLARGADQGFEVLGSLLDQRVEAWARLGRAVRERATGMTAEAKARAHDLLYPDLFSEFDARFLSAYARSLDLDLSPSFWRCERTWAADEELHYLGFRTIYGALFDRGADELDAEMEARRHEVRFEPIADLFEDEFSIACLIAYDELATVRAYRANAAEYAKLGPEVVAFVRRVTADEGRHYRNFFKLLRERHAHRLSDLERVLDRIREREGVPYANTFVLDHDDGVWSEAIFDESAAVLRRHLHA